MLIKTMEDVHKCNFELLSAFDALCKNNDIKYFILGGTLLGAVRHKDFIPWDDDVDVVLFREDYEKLCKIPEKEYPEGLKFSPPAETGAFWDVIPRIIDTKNTGTGADAKNTAHPSGEHPYIDLFILDNSYGGVRQRLTVAALLFIYSLARGHRTVIHERIKISPTLDIDLGMMEWIIRLIQWIGRRIPLEKEQRWYQSVSKRCKKGKMLYTSNEVPFILNKGYDTSWFSDTVFLSIRGSKFPAPKGYDDYLRLIYGDYEKLPPKNSRKPAHFLVQYDIDAEN
jgi:lipopolysaccharide cholinephosphotransferase